MLAATLRTASRQAAAGLAREFSRLPGGAQPAAGRGRLLGAAAALLAGSVGGVALCLSPDPPHQQQHAAQQAGQQQQAAAEAARAGPARAGAAPAEPKEPDLWDRWEGIKAFLGGWRKGAAAEVPLPMDKLTCHLPPGGYSAERYRPAVLVSCGSFNPPTFMHLRMLELARQHLTKAGWDVLGCYLSPVNDAYWKQALAAGRHRVRMCQLAAADSDSVMVDSWEVEQRQYTRTYWVLQRVARELQAAFGAGAAPKPAEPAAGGCPPVAPRVLLVCGADVLHSMADPALWRQDLLEALLSQHGVVCVTRAGAEAARLLDEPGSLLNRYRAHVAVVEEPVPNEISSSRVRHELERGHSVRYLLPDPVARYIYDHGLYGTAGPPRPRVLHPGAAMHAGAGARQQEHHSVDVHRVQPRVWVFDPTLGVLVDACDLASPPYVLEPCGD